MQNNTYRTIVLSALLIGIFLPLVCGLTAYAAQLEVSSPYFNFRIGPPLVDSGNASVSPNPNEGTDVNSDAVSTSLGTCLLNVVCINPIVKDDPSAAGEGLELDATISGAGEDGIDLSVDVGADAGIEIGVGPGEEDGLDLDLDLDDSGAEVDLDVGDDIGLDLDLDLDDGLDLDLDLGLP